MPDANQTVEKNKRAVDSFARAWADGRVDELMSLMTEGCSYRASAGPDPGGHVEGRDAVRAAFASAIQNAGAMESYYERIIVADERHVVTEWGFHKGGPPPESAWTRGCDIFTCDRGKIVCKDAYRKVLA